MTDRALTELAFDDIRFVVNRLPHDVRQLIKAHGLYLAGGFIRAIVAGEEPSDVDLFGISKEQLTDRARILKENRADPLTREIKTHNAITIMSPSRIPVQFITRWTYTNAIDLVQQFDFTVCAAAIWWDGLRWASKCDADFYKDLAARRLVYRHPIREEEAGGSMLRVIKYVKRGYNIQPASLGGVIERLVSNVRTETGMPTLHVIVGLLREVDPGVAFEGEDIQEHAE